MYLKITISTKSYMSIPFLNCCPQGHLSVDKTAVTIKVPRVPDFIRKEKKEVKTHIEEARRLLATNFRKPRGEHLVRYLNVSYDDFRKEIWVVSDFIPSDVLTSATRSVSTWTGRTSRLS